MKDTTRVVTVEEAAKKLAHPRLSHDSLDVLVAASMFMPLHKLDALDKLRLKWGITDDMLQNKYAVSRGLDIIWRAGFWYTGRKADRVLTVPIYGISRSMFCSLCYLHRELTTNNKFIKLKFI